MAFLQVSIEQAVFRDEGCRYFMTVEKSLDSFSSITSENKQFKTSLSGKTKFPIFNFYSFNLGDIQIDDPGCEIIFKAFKIAEVKNKQVTTEIGTVKVP